MNPTKSIPCSCLLATSAYVAIPDIDEQPLSGSEIYDRANAASVEVLIRGHLAGSGWFASRDGLVVTAAHVLPVGEEAIEILSPTVGRLGAELVATPGRSRSSYLGSDRACSGGEDHRDALRQVETIRTGRSRRITIPSLKVACIARDPSARDGKPWPPVRITARAGDRDTQTRDTPTRAAQAVSEAGADAAVHRVLSTEQERGLAGQEVGGHEPEIVSAYARASARGQQPARIAGVSTTLADFTRVRARTRRSAPVTEAESAEARRGNHVPADDVTPVVWTAPDVEQTRDGIDRRWLIERKGLEESQGDVEPSTVGAARH